MYRVGYIDDEPTKFENYSRIIKHRCDELEMVLLDGCTTKKDFVDKIYLEQIDVLLIDYRMASNFGFDGTTLIHYINDQIRDLECFILTAVDSESINDGLVVKRNQYSKTVFDTEAGNDEKETKLKEFLDLLEESASVFQTRREQRVGRYRELLDEKNNGTLGADEEEFLELYKVLSSYGIVEKLPKDLLTSEFEKNLNRLLSIGDIILENHEKK